MTDMPTGTQTHQFQAEVAELLHMMVHSVYSERDIFLRELISNASDACDKLRYEAIASPELTADDPQLSITIRGDKDAGTLTISDNGVGMDRQELIDNLGTIARSGTKAFVKRLAEAKEGAGLIGQFGVGFYSAFMVADRIEVTSRKAGTSEVWTWVSAGGAGFEVAPASADDAGRVPRGTQVVLHLKDEAKTYAEAFEIERLVRTYSDHILFPIMLAEEKGQIRQINAASAVWQRSKSELKPEDYTQAYRTIAGAFDDPAMTLHYRAEGRQSYAVLLFSPSTRPFDFFDPERKGRIKLYVRRVFITDAAELLPPYLRFMRGVIDSEDLPLNVSREMLQNNAQVAQIRKAVTSRVVSELETLAAKEPEKFASVWEAFGSVIKEGIYEDHERRAQLLRLARFRTTRDAHLRTTKDAHSRTTKDARSRTTIDAHSRTTKDASGDGGQRALADYVADMRPGQSAIYYLTGDSFERITSSPKLEAAKARGIEVLLLADHVDSFWTSAPHEFDGKPLKSLSQGDVDFGEVVLLDEAKGEAEASKPTAIDDAVIAAAVKAVLGDRVANVRASQRLTDSAACLVAEGKGPDRELERLLAMQDRGTRAKPILEINTKHALVKAITDAKLGAREADVADLSELLLDQARILDGEVPDDPAAFAVRVNRLVVRGLG